jgi:hypothetical protein
MTRRSHNPPPGSEIVRAAHQGGRRDSDPVLMIVSRLYEHHSDQWDYEDACRAGCTDTRLGQLKRLIDSLNEQRSKCIDEIDELLTPESTAFPYGNGTAPAVHTETFGIIIDRIVIASVRLDKLSRGQVYSAEMARRQRDQLVAAYDRLCKEVSLGQRLIPSWRLLKRYGSERRS